jgi:hypothetical protein
MLVAVNDLRVFRKQIAADLDHEISSGSSGSDYRLDASSGQPLFCGALQLWLSGQP